MNKKLVLKPIEDPSRKKVTTSKRKKCIFKKAIELSVLCNLDVFMVVFDREKQSISQLTSDPDFDDRVVAHMLERHNREQFRRKTFTNENYKDFLNEKVDNQEDNSDSASMQDNSVTVLKKRNSKKSQYSKDYVKEQ